MPKSISQLLILIVTCFALISQVWADTVMVCDMQMEHGSNHTEMMNSMSHQDHKMMGHDMTEHHTSSEMASSDTAKSSDNSDCCDSECSCQHGICPNLVFLNHSVLITTKTQETDSFGFTPNAALAVYIPSPFKPPIV
jgi:ABC-type nickel/cobalt efflux system permease component RcnA